MGTDNLLSLLVCLAVILTFARGLGEVFRLMKQPVIIGEILAGIFLGPSVFGYFFPAQFANIFTRSAAVNSAIDGITQIGLVFLLLVSGIEVDLTTVMKQSRPAFFTSIFGFLVPFLFGCFGAYFFPSMLGGSSTTGSWSFALFIGTSFSITALPVVARTLMDIGIFKSVVGQTVIASAMLIDLIGWLVFSVIISTLGTRLLPFSIAQTIGITMLFIIAVLLVGRKLIHFVLPKVQSALSFPGGVINFIIILGLLAAAFTEYVGVHAVFGAFIIGIAIGDSPHLKQETRELVQQFVTNIFAPLFFVSIGMKANFISDFNPALTLILILIAVLTKITGSSIGARMGGLNKQDSMIVAFGMNSRGAMEIILGVLGLQFGLINQELFVAIVIMALVTSISSGPLMNFFMRRSSTFTRPSLLLSSGQTIFLKSKDRSGAIHELSALAARRCKLSKPEIAESVLQREKEFATGLARGLAIPHARLPIPHPILCAGIAKEGVSFDAADGLPARLVFLLLTPLEEHEKQLELLAGLAKLAEHENIVDDIASRSSSFAAYQRVIFYLSRSSS